LKLLESKDADVGITGADYAVAATGSVALSSRYGRLATLLPFHHVVLLCASQILPDLEDLYAQLGSLELPSAWGMHTGPSKSADIEQTMALGVHGPGIVDVIVILNS
jgi:L-lactate dehydrogenase complex protein LldG